jgi:tripartite-type tricarboxylate transporter receptor subunit TctC
MGLLAPAGTPAAIIERLNSTTVKAVAAADTRSRLGALGGEVSGSTPNQFAAHIRGETAKWGKLIKAAGIEVEQL